MLKAILVDMDGTLVESATANATAYSEALAEWGIVVDPIALAPRINGRSWRDFLPGLIGDRLDVIAADVASRKRVIYPDFLHLLRPNLTLIDLLRLVHGRVATGLVTTASFQAVTNIMDRYDLHDLFDVMICGDYVDRAKPDPEAYIQAAARLAVLPSECLVIEDSEVGVMAALAFGGHTLRWLSQIQS